jgi:predicted nuclease of predicted toxin-antitoxin system
VRFFVDNNLPEKLAQILDILECAIEVRHIKDLFPANTKDVEWIKALADEGNWLILTQDISITKRRLELCALRESGLSIICLEKGWSSLKFYPKTAKLIGAWPNILEVASKARTQAIWSVSVGNCKIQDLTNKLL